MIAGAVKQFWNEAVWGDVDYLFVDMPPGTGDVSAYRVPVPSGGRYRYCYISTGTGTDDRKESFPYGKYVHIPVLGLVENFSYLKCPGLWKEDRTVWRKQH